MRAKLFANYKLLLFLFLIALAIYYPTWESGFVTDWMAWMYRYQKGDWTDILNCFGYPGLHQVFHAINYPLYKICFNNHFLWYIPYALMHGLNAWLVYLVTKQIAARFNIQARSFLTIGVTALFFLSPYQVEPVTWKVCLHYLLSFAFLMVSIGYLFRTFDSQGKSSNNIKHHFFFLLALLTLEISLAAPFIFLSLGLVYWMHKGQSREVLKKVIVGLGINILILIAYFMTNKLYIGSWVGHYGEEQHLKFDWVLIGGNGIKYLEKYLLLLHYWPFDIKMKLYNFFDGSPINIGAGLGLLTLIGAIAIVFFKKLDGSLKLAFFGLISFFMAIFPIANLFFMRIHPYENDRYGYLASFFFYLFFVVVIYRLPKYLRTSILVLFVAINIFFLGKMLKTAHHAGSVHRGLVSDFPFYDRDDIIFLSAPDNYKGMCLFRDLSGKAVAFRESLDLFVNKPFSGEMEDAAEVNMRFPTDGVKVEPIDSLTAQVMIISEGTWFWKDGFGLNSYENDLYSVELHGWYYLIKFKEKPVGKTLLYFQGKEWKEFKLPE